MGRSGRHNWTPTQRPYVEHHPRRRASPRPPVSDNLGQMLTPGKQHPGTEAGEYRGRTTYVGKGAWGNPKRGQGESGIGSASVDGKI